MRLRRAALVLTLILTVGVLGLVASPGWASTTGPETVFGFGDAGFYGSSAGIPGAQALAGMAATPTGHGYWLAAVDGGVFSFGDAAFYGSLGGKRLNAPVVGIASTPSGHGYWLAAADGGVFSFGDAAFYGSMGARRLNSAVVGMASTPSGHGYWLTAADGGVFSFGDAAFYGSMGGRRLSSPVVGMASTPSGRGYWLVAADGGVFSFGDAVFHGSAVSSALLTRFSGIAATPSGTGYWLVATNGGVFSFGNAGFFGSAAGLPTGRQAVGIEASPSGNGYWVVSRATPASAGSPSSPGGGTTTPGTASPGTGTVPTIGVNVYFSRAGVAACDAVYPVSRAVTPPQVLTGAMTALLAGPTPAETAAGYRSFFSSATAGTLNWAHVYDNGLARVDFANFSSIIPNASSSCGSQGLLAALDHTATQFASVKSAVYSFDGSVAAFYEWLQMVPPTVGPTTPAPGLVGALSQAYGQEQALSATYSGVVAALGSVGPFPNVVSAEGQHISTITTLAANHQVSLPAGPVPAQAAPTTLAAACQLGVSLEQATVSMYGALLPQVAPWADVTQAFQNLQSAAAQHLTAFQSCGSPPTSSSPATPVLTGALAQAYGQELTLSATYSNVITALGSVGPFLNMVSAETQHVSTVTTLALNHQVSLPGAPVPGQASPTTLAAACQLGASLEQATVSMYGTLLPEVAPWADVTQAFQNLQSAATQHLTAFQRCS